jgi:hypothetical protein
LEIRDGKANFFNKTTICLSSYDFQLDKNTLRSFDICQSLGWINEGTSEHFVNNIDAVDLIAEDIRQDVIIQRRKEGLNDLTRRLGLRSLVYDAQDRERRELVRTKM